MGLKEQETEKLKSEIKDLELILKVKQHSLRELLAKSHDNLILMVPEDVPDDEKFVSVTQAAEILHASTKSIRAWITRYAVRSELAARGKLYSLAELRQIANEAAGRKRLGLTS